MLDFYRENVSKLGNREEIEHNAFTWLDKVQREFYEKLSKYNQSEAIKMDVNEEFKELTNKYYDSFRRLSKAERIAATFHFLYGTIDYSIESGVVYRRNIAKFLPLPLMDESVLAKYGKGYLKLVNSIDVTAKSLRPSEMGVIYRELSEDIDIEGIDKKINKVNKEMGC